MVNMSDPRVKRLVYRSRYTGTKELDTLLGRFVDRHLADMSADLFGQLEDLIGNSDPDLFEWISGRKDPPPFFDNEIMGLLRQFNAKP